MRTRRMAIAAIVVLLAVVVGWVARGWNPEISCKEKGGFYSEKYRVCVFAEPTDAALKQAYLDAKLLLLITATIDPVRTLGGAVGAMSRR
jgi:hypothetical protein